MSHAVLACASTTATTLPVGSTSWRRAQPNTHGLGYVLVFAHGHPGAPLTRVAQADGDEDDQADARQQQVVVELLRTQGGGQLAEGGDGRLDDALRPAGVRLGGGG